MGIKEAYCIMKYATRFMIPWFEMSMIEKGKYTTMNYVCRFIGRN